MIHFKDSCDKKFGLIEYRSKKHGSYLYSPVYSPLELIVSARGKKNFRGKKQMLVVYEEEDKESISPIEFEVIDGDCTEIIPVKDDCENELYIINPRNDGVVVRFLIGLYLTDFNSSDIEHDNHMSGFLLSFAENIRNGIGARDEKDRLRLAREAYRYVSRMPTIPYKQKTGKVRTPTKSIESGTAHDICVCKSEIFKDLCKLLGIPAREQAAEYYSEGDIREYSKTKKESRKEQLHSFCAFYTDQWRLADPTLGGFNSTFRVKEYYREIFSAKGFDKIAVEARRL
ncbi:hypothetical protein J4443_00250 [Candidatus Woesearchaeota archaeon]|nr:hypothetical protein [Candidatus Woesearchaeota archaeon]